MSVMIFALLLVLLPPSVFSTFIPPIFETYTLPNNTIGPAYFSTSFLSLSALTGISNGDVVTFNLLTKTFTYFASEPNRNGTLCDSNTNNTLFETCGRPLGIAQNSSGYVYFCDVYKGLFGVGPSGGQATPLVSFAGGLPVHFCNAVDIDASGNVYFTDASQNFRSSNMSASSGDSTGRFIRYVPSTGNVAVLATGLDTPTGLAVSSDSSFVLISQLGNNSISKYYLTGSNANTLQTFVSGIYRPANVRLGIDQNHYYVPQTTSTYIHYLIKMDSYGVVVGNVSIAGPYSSAITYRDAREILPSKFLLGSRYTSFVGIAFIAGF